MERLYKFLNKFGAIPYSALSEQEVASLTNEIRVNYAKSRSLLTAIKLSVPKEDKYRPFLKLAKSVELGMIPDVNGFYDKNSESASTLLNILILGLRQRSKVNRNLENFHTNLVKKTALKNKIKARVNGMQVLSLLGLLFFLPLFSGISSSLATYSLTSSSARANISSGIRAICLGYIFEILLITSSFLKPAERFLLVLSKTLPLLACSYLFQSAAYYLASYAI